MKERKLLDCTLRDGGYLNDWEFGHEEICSIFERLVSTGVDIIEIGFLDDRREFDINRTIMPNTDCVQKIYGKIDKRNAIIVGMIDFGTCKIENIKPCSECYLDGIRVIFKEHLMYDALEFCRQIKNLGYKVFAQLVSVTTYTDEKLLELIDLVNDVEPYALSMVDTYGLLHQNNLMHIFHILDKNLKKSISLGYHAHNNFQMGYANGISFINSDVDRTLLVDGSLYGMGKSAGNTPIELLAMYLNDNYGKHYDVGQMLEAIETNILKIKEKAHWGYELFYYVSAATKCHPNYVSYFMNKGTLSMKSINELLLSIEDSKKLMYDVKVAEEAYLNYQKTECDDTEAFQKLIEQIKGKKVMVFGPGKSVKKQESKIIAYLKNHPDKVIFAVNYIPTIVTPNYIFITNSKRYVQSCSELNESEYCSIPIVATSNVVKANGKFDYIINYSNLIDEEAKVPDNSLVMLLKIFLRVGIKRIDLIGFDGYMEDEMNYLRTNMEYSLSDGKAEYLNHYVDEFIRLHKKDLQIDFITDTHYSVNYYE